MPLHTARLPDGTRPLADHDGPVPTARLGPLVGQRFALDADDPFVEGSGDAAHAYLDLAREAWREHPEHMDFLDPDSPVHALKALERDLYLHHWAEALDGAGHVLDVGSGIGRFSLWALSAGRTVTAVDPDLRSLQRLVWRAAAGPGRLQVHWSHAQALPEVQVDAAIACEVLCYVPETEAALAALASRVRPGGVVCLSMEARWGWAAAVDVTPGAIGHALVGDGEIDVPGGGWVRTLDAADLEAWVTGAGLVVEAVVPHHYVLDGPLERAAPEEMSLDVLLDLEAAAAAHPVWAPLNRIWSVIARRPG